MNLKSLLTLVLLAALWGASFLFIRLTAHEVGPFGVALARVSVAALTLWLIAAATRTSLQFKQYVRRFLILGALNSAIPFALVAFAELRLSASLASMLNATIPLFTALAAAVWLGGKVDGG